MVCSVIVLQYEHVLVSISFLPSSDVVHVDGDESIRATFATLFLVLWCSTDLKFLFFYCYCCVFRFPMIVLPFVLIHDATLIDLLL